MSAQPYPPLRPQPPVRRRGRRTSPWPLVAGIVVLAILVTILAVILANGGAGEGSSSPGPSTSAGASGAPSAGAAAPSGTAAAPTSPPAPTPPPPVVAPPEGILPVGSVAVVTADGLRMRQAPATTAPIVTSLGEGDELYLVTDASALGPVETGGFIWYFVMGAPGYHDWPAMPPPEQQFVGWVAAGSSGESFLALAPAVCPIGEVDLAGLYALTAWERLACLGDRQLTLEGTFGCAGCGGLVPGTFQPEWLAQPESASVFRPPWSQPLTAIETIVLRVPPEVQALDGAAGGSVLRVTGHFNDARSVDCVVAPGEPEQERPANDLAAEFYCREQFVVDAWEVIGTDPDFGG